MLHMYIHIYVYIYIYTHTYSHMKLPARRRPDLHLPADLPVDGAGYSGS